MHYKGLFVGLTTIDIQYFVDEFPGTNIKIKTNPPDIMVGGPATNAAVGFAHLNQGAYLLSTVGNNSFSSFILNDFVDHGVEFFDFAEGVQVNPVVASVVTSGNGNRNIFTHNPAAIENAFDIQALFSKTKPDILLLDGFYPEHSIACAIEARKQNIPVIIDCGSWKPQYEQILQYTDIAICSADFFPPSCTSSSQVFSYLASTGVINMAISRGEKSILFKKGTECGEIEVKPVKVLDTLGAGDFFHGAFCYFWLEERNFEIALLKASEVAGFSCTYKGTREWLKYHN